MMFACAQKKYVYIYDQTGLELHCLKDMRDVNKLTFLPYHFLLVSAVSQKGGATPKGCRRGRVLLRVWGMGWSCSLRIPYVKYNLWKLILKIHFVVFDGLQGNNGSLCYLDSSVGRSVTTRKIGMGPLRCMTHNPYNAVVHLGHNNGRFLGRPFIFL